MHSVRMLLDNIEVRIREQLLKRAIRHDHHALLALDHPELR